MTKEEKVDEQKMQELYMQFNMINHQMAELQKQIQMLEETIQEVHNFSSKIFRLGTLAFGLMLIGLFAVLILVISIGP